VDRNSGLRASLIGREHRPSWIGEDAGTGEILAEEVVIRKPAFGGAVERFKDVGE
jgi:hypothetical protein